MKKIFLKYPLLFISLLAIILRLPLLNGSFWLDEAAQALEVIRPLSEQLNIVADFQPPLLHLVLHFVAQLSWSEWLLRSFAALIPAIITIIFSYKISQQLYSKTTAIVASFLLATSSFHLFYSQELRPYSLSAALASVSFYFFVKLNQEQKPKKETLIKLAVFNALGLYSTYLYPFFILAQVSYLAFTNHYKNNKQIVLTYLITALSFVPILPLFLKQLEAGQLVRLNLPGWERVVSVPQLKALPLVFAKLIFGVLPLDLNWITVTLGLALGFSLVTSLYYLKDRVKVVAKVKILLYWILVPVTTAWLVSFIVPVIRPKRFLFTLPAIYILLAQLTSPALKKVLKKGLSRLEKLDKYLLLVLIVTTLINFISVTSYYSQSKLQRENWRGLYQEISAKFDPETTILIYSFPEEFAPMRWYQLQSDKQFPSFTTKTLNIASVTDLDNKIKLANNYQTVLVFDYLRDLTDPERKIEASLTQLGFKEVSVLDYPNIGFVRIFIKPINLIGYKI